MTSDYWNNIDSPGLMISKNEWDEWIKTSQLIDGWYPYHDMAGGYERLILLEKNRYEYHLIDFNDHTPERTIIYIIRRIKKCHNQDGDGI